MTRGLPANTEVEGLVLGAVLMGASVYPAGISEDYFSVDRHRQIWRAMTDLRARGVHVDRVTVLSKVNPYGKPDGTLSYLVSLDEGLPHIPHLDSYIAVLRELAERRRL